MPKPQYSGEWPKVRRLVLERDGGTCIVRGPRCTGVATEVDHIVPLALGGDRLDPDNLRASCKSCNSSRGTAMRNRKVAAEARAFREGATVAETVAADAGGLHLEPGEVFDPLARGSSAAWPPPDLDLPAFVGTNDPVVLGKYRRLGIPRRCADDGRRCHLHLQGGTCHE